MTRDYHSTYQPATYATPSRGSTSSDAESRLPRRLFIAVAVLGLACYGFSFGPAVYEGGAIGWNVRFAALAGLCAAFGLLRNQKPPTLATAVLAAMGFLDALSSVVSVESHWALSVILVLNASQTAAAIAALVLWHKAREQHDASGYEAYVDYYNQYNQAVRDYYTQQASTPPPEMSQHSGYGQAYGRAAATAQRTQRASQYGDYSDFVAPQSESNFGASAAGAPPEPSRAGMPGVRSAAARVGQPQDQADESARPASPQ